jgi:hypothetical protein
LKPPQSDAARKEFVGAAFSGVKMRIGGGQEFVIGGYTPSSKNFDALLVGYYKQTS